MKMLLIILVISTNFLHGQNELVITEALKAVDNLNRNVAVVDLNWIAISNNNSKSEIYLLYKNGEWFGASYGSIKNGGIARIELNDYKSYFNNLVSNYNSEHIFYNDLPKEVKQVVNVIKKLNVGQKGGTCRLFKNDQNLPLAINQNLSDQSGLIIWDSGKGSISLDKLETTDLKYLNKAKNRSKLISFLERISPSYNLESMGQFGICISKSNKWYYVPYAQNLNDMFLFSDFLKVIDELKSKNLFEKIIRSSELTDRLVQEKIMRISVFDKKYWEKFTSIRPTLLFTTIN